MYTAHIGRRILDLYNAHRHTGPPLSAREFFDKVFFPLFFDDTRYLMLANNSKFDQAAKQQKKKPLTPEVRREALALFHTDVATLEQPHGHLFLGGSARKQEAATSSQVSAIDVPVNQEEVYYSWIGAAAGIGIKGGLCLLIDHKEILLSLIDGWSMYRRFLNPIPNLKPYQIETWNGWWQIHASNKNYTTEDPLRSFPLGANEPKLGTNGILAFSTPPWIRVLFALAKQSQSTPLMAYAYSFGQTNTTIGFIQLNLEAIHRIPTLYNKLFGDHDRRDRDNLVALYETEIGFKTACQQGTIGLRAIQPKNLQKHLPSYRHSGQLPKPPKKDQEKTIFRIYQTWIIAMLNNEDLLVLALKTAEALDNFRSQSTRGKKTHASLIKDVLGSNSAKSLIENLTAILHEDTTHKEHFDNLVTQMVKMPPSNVPLFLALVRFKYAYVSSS